MEAATVRTPGGHRARFYHRPGTNDRLILGHVCDLDEYRLAGLELAGWAADVGAHIGGVAVSLAIDHPTLQVLALEPVRSSSHLLARNAALNRVEGRITVIPRAVASDDEGRTITIGRAGPQRHVGNLDTDGDAVQVASITLTQALSVCGAFIVALLKIDCEGCEAETLQDPAVARIPLIVGEYHGDPAEISALLEQTHDVTTVGYTFQALRR